MARATHDMLLVGVVGQKPLKASAVITGGGAELKAGDMKESNSGGLRGLTRVGDPREGEGVTYAVLARPSIRDAVGKGALPREIERVYVGQVGWLNDTDILHTAEEGARHAAPLLDAPVGLCRRVAEVIGAGSCGRHDMEHREVPKVDSVGVGVRPPTPSAWAAASRRSTGSSASDACGGSSESSVSDARGGSSPGRCSDCLLYTSPSPRDS